MTSEIMMKKHFFINEDGSFRVLSSDAALKQFYENCDGSRIIYKRCTMTCDSKHYVVFVDVNFDVHDAYIMLKEIIKATLTG
ncbi:hypothetical protein L4D77_00130 [Photobacterium frigidiphilum]|uniref:Uncharacterized protein n=1 Tax=Photobacterium profundum (strain SS9) TaxID=298386 RepID=Q6LSG4_PHOPR|nr:hypothetical protein PBPRA1351 [Photobacterium profundum SS9]